MLDDRFGARPEAPDIATELPLSADAVEKVRFEVVASAGFGSGDGVGGRLDASRRRDRRRCRDQQGELAKVLGSGGEKELVMRAVRSS